MPDQPRTFQTSPAQANRARQQGLGVGQRELDAQTDPEVKDDGIEDEVERLTGEDFGPATGAVHGETHTRRPERTEVQIGHGRKTRAAIRETVKGRR